jgi:hypothetical protein
VDSASAIGHESVYSMDSPCPEVKDNNSHTPYLRQAFVAYGVVLVIQIYSVFDLVAFCVFLAG